VDCDRADPMTANNYVTLSDVKAEMPTNEVSTTNIWDTLITNLCTTLSRLFDKYTNRKPGAYNVTADVTRYFDGPSQGMYSPVYGFKTQRLSSGYTGAIKLYIGELAQFPTSVAVAENGQIDTEDGANNGNYTVWPQTDFYGEPTNAFDEAHPYNFLSLDIIYGTHRIWYPYKKGIKIVGRFGYATSTPDPVHKALLLLVVKYVRKAQQNYLQTGSIMDATQVMSGSKPDDDLADLIELYRKKAV